jgi:hypothetical protein
MSFMTRHKGLWLGAMTLVAVLGSTRTANAARLRYHYVPAACDAVMTLAPSTFGTPGARTTIRGTCPDNREPPRATCVKTFRHPCSGRTVNVPLNLPGNPNVYYRTNAVLYDYAGDFVEVRFLTDGSVDVIYSTGWLRTI